LVDELGGIEEAIAYAAEKAGLESFSIKEFPKQEDMFKSLLKTDKQEYYTKTILKDKLGDKAQYLEALERLNQIEGVQALMPLYFYN
jgi:protease-4